MKDKILLINPIPASMEKKENNFPLGLLSIATYILKNSHFKVKIIDCLVEDNYEDMIKKEIHDTLLVGVSVMSSAVPNALLISKLIKALSPSMNIVWGGTHCRLYASQTAAHPLVDVVCRGEGENVMLELAYYFAGLSKRKSLEDIQGISYKWRGCAIANTPIDDPIDLDELGVLRYDLLNPKVWEAGKVPYLSSRGCPHNCSFCINTAIGNHNWRPVSAENVVKEIEHLVKTYDIKIFNFADECFFVNRKRAEKILTLLEKKKFKLKFASAGRVDYFGDLISMDMLKRMKKLGWYDIGMGFEFGSQKMLDFVNKGTTLAQQKKAIKMLKQAKMGATYSFMTGFPTETKEDTQSTIDLIKYISTEIEGINVTYDNEGNVIQWDDRARINGPQPYRAYAGGEIFDFIVKNYGWKNPQSLEEWSDYFTGNTRYKIEDYPWLEDPSYYAGLQFYLKNGKYRLVHFIIKMMMPYPAKLKFFFALFYPFARIRYLANYFNHPVEYKIGKWLGVVNKYEI